MKTYTVLFAAMAFCVALAACDQSDPAAPAAKAAVDSAKNAVENTGHALKSAAQAAKTETQELIEKGRESHVGAKTAVVLDKTGEKAKEVLQVTADKTRNLAQKVKDNVDGGATNTTAPDNGAQK